ncbi:Metal cation transporter [Nitrosopumilaceae archaeon]|nr:divalent cation transporter [Nitrosopumilus sp.]MDA7945772.1 divalent cation transporter [Nitrosopumilus sp.]MDA7974475.1 divalent cation transporter [Nitrosopumilus sp.]CAI9831031.1 Metal cation transporter [Nitrosopumilaceae archaeon]
MEPRRAAAAAAPAVLLCLLLAYVLGPGAGPLGMGVPLPEITVERVDFEGSEIRATVRNTGPIPVEIAHADVNDRIQPAAVEPDRHLERFEAATVRIPFEWNEAEPYVVGITVGDGTRFEVAVAAAAPATPPSWGLAGSFAAIGALVGVVPVAIGMLWLPLVRSAGAGWRHAMLAFTAGLLLFLAIDSGAEALDIAGSLAGAFDGPMLVATSAVLAFLALHYSASRLAGAAAAGISISVGIGLHNFGEGLAIGAAIGIGSLAFGSSLAAGFALHNVTEGLAIAAAVARRRPAIPALAALVLIAGGPAILGTWTGGFAYWPAASAVFLGAGAGAILQVVISVAGWIRSEGGSLGRPGVAGGAAAGMLVMYVTSLLV